LKEQFSCVSVSDNFWVGGSDLENEDEWKWMTSDTYFDYINWADNQPSSDNGLTEPEIEDCIDLRPTVSGWNDEVCSHSLRFICEQSESSM